MRFVSQTTCFFGDSRYDDFQATFGDQFSRRGLAVVDESVADSFHLRELLDSLTRGAQIEMLRVSLCFEPTYDQLDSLAAEARDIDPDYIIGVGGGSVLDLAKGVALLLTNEGNGRDYRGFGRVAKAPRPLIAVPTTAGSGSEATWTASLIDDETGVKFGINGQHVFPIAAFLEPRLLIDCPTSVAISAALDALVHAVEAVSSPFASELVSALASRSVALVTENLEHALTNREEDSWQRVQLGAYSAGLAMLNSSGGIASALSYPIGVEFRVPHGFAGGIILPRILKINSTRGYKGYETLGFASSESFTQYITDLYTRLEVPTNFRQWNVRGPEAARKLFDLTMEQRYELLQYNPTPFGEPELRRLLEDLCQKD